jgi:hypothetical protein
MDSLPAWIYQYPSLTRNDLAQLANVDAFPKVNVNFDDKHSAISAEILMNGWKKEKVESYVKELLLDNNLFLAWQLLLYDQQIKERTMGADI